MDDGVTICIFTLCLATKTSQNIFAFPSLWSLWLRVDAICDCTNDLAFPIVFIIDDLLFRFHTIHLQKKAITQMLRSAFIVDFDRLAAVRQMHQLGMSIYLWVRIIHGIVVWYLSFPLFLADPHLLDCFERLLFVHFLNFRKLVYCVLNGTADSSLKFVDLLVNGMKVFIKLRRAWIRMSSWLGV